ncbi:formin-like protein 14 [Lathyrus oleraceus]|uniref:FH2 domain-containing protein n=1 Tax=Pisum sativum TaxID=3888 RepID=A0A9D5BB21_PEA|nr:formin-like protein 14 [Pisum sativum]KAI5435939.1 hypothetical protein KIW84_022387 [Pisum sativum]
MLKAILALDSCVLDIDQVENLIKFCPTKEEMEGTARGSAVGFKLDSLLKLSDTCARNKKMTLVHYVCKLLAEKNARTDRIFSIWFSSKIQLEALAEKMQVVHKGSEKVEQELTASENDGSISSGFCKVLKNFLDFAEADVKSLTTLYNSKHSANNTLNPCS